MIEPKVAVENAVKYFTEITNNKNGLTLEELELSSDKKHWLVTIGYTETNEATNSISAILGANARKYKFLHVNAETGVVESMKIRDIAK